MMYEFSIENSAGNRIDLTNSSRCAVYQIDGLCPVPATLNFTDIAGQDGGLYNSGRIQKRNIVAYIKLYPDVEENRNYLYSFLVPKSKVRCYFQNTLHDVYIDGYVETCDVTPFSNNEVIQTSIICPNPFWNEANIQDISFSVVDNAFEFPFSASKEGLTLGEIKRTYSTIVSAGNAGGGFIFELHISGNVEKPKLYNMTTGEFWGFENTRIKFYDGDIVRVNTNIGEKNATLIRLYNALSLVGDMSDGSSFIQLVPGENQLMITADSGVENIDVFVKYQKHFLGV